MSAPDVEKDNEFNRTRADLFESIGHQTRIKILEAISQEPLTFSGLKKRMGIESSGHLSFHLEKLSNLVKSTPEGTYTLTDDGREALRLIQTVHGTETALVVPPSRMRPRSRRRLLGLAAIAIAVILVGAVIASAASGTPVYSMQETLQGSLQHYTPLGYSTIQFNNSAGTTITDFNFDLAGANLGNQTTNQRLFPLELAISHLQGTHLDSLQLQFSMGAVCCLDVAFDTQQGSWNPMLVNQNTGLVTVSIANFGYVGIGTVNIGLLLEPPPVNGNLSLSMSVQMTLQGQGTIIGHAYNAQFTLPLTVEPDRIIVPSNP